jgi:diguanylate cyclase (GGDEF)-like protein
VATEDHLILNGVQGNYVRGAIQWFRERYLNQIITALRLETGGIPKSLNDLFNDSTALHNLITSGRNAPDEPGGVLHFLPKPLLPVLKRVLLLYRRHLVAETEINIEKVADLELRGDLEKIIAGTSSFSNERWFIDAVPIKTPRLTDYLTLQRVEIILERLNASAEQPVHQLPVKQYDDKFGVLAAPSTLAPEMNYWRQQCELRNVGLALAYFDIDNFKTLFNTPYGETTIDRQCLPVIARAIEAYTFSHGLAYHEGGDEFIVLILNATKGSAIGFMEGLRVKMPALVFPGIDSKAHISIGLCHVEPDSILTDSEIKHHANLAKKYAKKDGGKNCIVTYRGENYTEDELVVVRPDEKG